MFNSNILDVAIGMVFVYLLLSLICSAANEMIELWLKMRAVHLERGIRELLKDPQGNGLVQLLYNHQLVNNLFQGKYDRSRLIWWQRWIGRVNLPSYIPARNFALALMDILLPGKGTANATPAPIKPVPLVVNLDNPPFDALTEQPDLLEPLRQRLQKSGHINEREGPAGEVDLLNDQVRETLLALVLAAGKDVAKARENIEAWFNSSMDRVSGWYKRRSQVIILIFGLFITIGVNADSVIIVKRLSTDRAMRESLVAAADAYATGDAKAMEELTPTSTATPTPPQGATTTVAEPKKPAISSPTPAQTPTPAVPSISPTSSPLSTSSAKPETCWQKSDACKKNADSPACKLKENQCRLEDLGLPIGWTVNEDGSPTWPGLHFWHPGDFASRWYPAIRLHFLGWLLTALAISLGAPFWFDTLNKFIVVRSAVKPREKSPDEGTKD